MRNPYLLFFILLCLSSCTKDGVIVGNVDPIQVQVIQRTPNTAVIKWTTTEDATGPTRYDIMLDGSIVKANLSTTTDTLKNLVRNHTYQGRVIARTNSGDTTSVPFTLEKLNDFLLYNVSLDGHLNCYDLFSGSPVWSSIDYGASFYGSSPIIVNDTMYVISSTGMRAIRFETFESIWTNPLGGGLTVYNNGVLYTASGSAITAINAKTGSTIWTNTYKLPMSFYHSPVIAGNYLITGTQTFLIAVNIANGTVAWQHEFGYGTNSIGHPVVYKDVIIKPASDSKIYALNNQTGEIVWTKDFLNMSNSSEIGDISPIIYEDKLITWCGSKGYCALNPLNGSIIWEYPNVFSVSSPAAGNGLIYYSAGVNSGPRQIIALDASTGKLAWSNDYGPYFFISPIFAKDKVHFGNATYYATSGETFSSRNFSYGTNLAAVVENGTGYYSAESGMVQ